MKNLMLAALLATGAAHAVTLDIALTIDTAEMKKSVELVEPLQEVHMSCQDYSCKAIVLNDGSQVLLEAEVLNANGDVIAKPVMQAAFEQEAKLVLTGNNEQELTMTVCAHN